MTTVLIADDQEMVRTGLRAIIDADPDLQVVAAVDNGHEALVRARELRPDVCVLDIRMPRMTGLEVTQELAQDDEAPAIVILTTYDLEEYLIRALQAGASGFVLKDAPSNLLTGAIHAAANGDALISPGLTRRLIETFVQHRSDPSTQAAFTPRERDVLDAVCHGQTNDEISRSLDMALSTVKGHIASLMQKTGATNRVKLVIWAYGHPRTPD